MATSFTNHSAGQIIASADINLIQTAVNALETAPASGPTVAPGILRKANQTATCDPLVTQGLPAALTAGTNFFSFFTAAASYTSTQVRYAVNSAAASSGAGTSIGLYSVDSSDNGTLIASVAGTALFTSTGSIVQTWAAGVALTQGSRYAVGFLHVAGSGTPQILAMTWGTPTTLPELAVVPRWQGQKTAQTTQANFTVGSLASSNPFFYAVVL